MSSDNKTHQVPQWIAAARKKWAFRGAQRPGFAIEPKEGQISVWDFPRPPAVLSVPHCVQVFTGDTLLARSDHALMVCETANPPSYYIPEHDVNRPLLTQITMDSWCEWKGQAVYWALSSNPQRQIAWSYPTPFEEYALLKNYIAFYPQDLRCFVGDERVLAQSSDFYAGWITANLVGPFKGEPGSESW